MTDMVTIVEGKFYVTRGYTGSDREVIGPIVSKDESHPRPWRCGCLDWTNGGGFLKGEPYYLDLTDGPFDTKEAAEAFIRGDAEPVRTAPQPQRVVWPEGATRISADDSDVAIDLRGTLVGVNGWTLTYYPHEARTLGAWLIAAADYLDAKKETEE